MGDSFPLVNRRNYRLEMVAATSVPLAIACVDMGVIGVVAKKAFDASPLVVALMESAPHAAAVSSVLWTSLMHGRDRVRFVVVMQLGLILCVAIAALVPASSIGLAMLVALVVASRCFFVGMLTGRTEVWRSNYQRGARARATGNFTIVSTLVLAVTTLVLGLLLDYADRHGGAVLAYRVFYLCAAVIASVGVLSYARIRWRRGRSLILAERAGAKRDRPGLRSMWLVWRDDANYRSYMNAQMVMGSANLAALVATVLAVTGRFDLHYTVALAITAIIPKLMVIVAIPFWSRLLQRKHIVDFRAIHAWSFVIGNGLVGVGVLTLNVPLLLIARGIVGAGMGGGSLAWNLGHHDFAPRGQTNSYMSLHVLLTGLRGAIAPLLGAYLYEEIMGGWLFILCAAFGAVGAMMFMRLRSKVDRTPRDAAG